MPDTLTRTERKKLRTRELLLDATRDAVVERGLGDVAIADVTERADVALGTFYNYFSSKEEIFAALADRTRSELDQRLEHLADSVEDPAAALTRLVFAFFDWFEEDKARAAYVIRASLEQEALRTYLGPTLEKTIRRGVDEGQFIAAEPPISALVVGGGILAVMAGRVRRFVPKRGTREELVCELLRLLGLSQDEARTVVEHTR